MFDITLEIPVKILSGTEKRCRVKYPTDEQWKARASRQRLIKRSLGRGRTEYEPLNPGEVDAELFLAIRLDSAPPEFDAAEASKVIEKLERVEVIDTGRIGDEYKIEVLALGCTMQHYLKIPTQQQVIDYGRAAVKSHDERRYKVIRVSLEPAEGLYKDLLSKNEGYVGAVPVTHKSTVISELLGEIEAAGDDDSGF